MKPAASMASVDSRATKTLSTEEKRLLVLLFLVPGLLILGKWSGSPASAFLMRHFSLASVPADLADRVHYVLFVPLGALLVVFFRLSLGIRLLGPFRSILIAVAFQITGILAGLAFLAVVLGVMVGFRPLIKGMALPYFARVSVMLCAVSLLMILAVYCCEWMGMTWLRNAAYFPIVVICLTAEGFARTWVQEGFRSALWRGGMTAGVAVLITLVASVPGLKKLLTVYPELLLAQVGAIILIAYHGDWRLFQDFNPPPRKAKRTKGSRTRKKTGGNLPGSKPSEAGAGKQTPHSLTKTE